MSNCIFIIDDEQETREALKWLVESLGYTVKTYEGARQFLEDYSEAQIGCVILDVRMPEITGLELQEMMKQKSIDLPIIFISAHGSIPMAIRAVKLGAIDFLTKPIDRQSLLEAINRSIRLHQNTRNIKMEKEAINQLTQRLTPREYEIMKMMIDGKASKVIAHNLSISTSTVELHRTHVLRKMGVRSTVELAKLTVSKGLNLDDYVD